MSKAITPFVSPSTRSGGCFECGGGLKLLDNICQKCGWDATDYL